MISKINTERQRWRRPVLPMVFLAAWLGCLGASPVGAHDPESIERLPGWTVLVLKLVSTTHVEPTTGIVVSPEGHVVVPAEFVADGLPLVVLDGGADVVRNGRPAELQQTFRLEGLALLRVDYLSRTPAPFAEAGLSADQPVLLLTFPPAEQISAGETRIARLATVPGDGTLGPALGLPNVTGPLVNGCQQVLGFSAARGVQSMGSSAQTLYHRGDDLLHLLSAVGLAPVTAACDHSLLSHEPPVEPDDLPPAAVEPASEPPAELAEPTEPPANEENPDEPPQALESGLPQGPVVDPDDDAEALKPANDAEHIITGDQEQATEDSLATPDTEPQPGEDAAPTDPPPAPGTPEATPGAPAPAGGLIPDWAWWALVVLGLVLGVTAWRSRGRAGPSTIKVGLWLRPMEPAGADDIPVPLSRGVIEATLGRFETDIVLSGSSISRRHARLTGTPNAINLVDLGSSNGTWVNEARCEAGRSVPLTDGDTIRLGEQQFRVVLTEARVTPP